MVDLVWSYSMLDTFEQCPKKWHRKYILKEKEPESEAIRYGNYVHKRIENFLRGDVLPVDLDSNAAFISSIKNRFTKDSRAELKMGVTKELEKTGFFDFPVWGRGAADVVLMQEGKPHAFIGDWKTGKRRDKDDQLGILSLFLMKHYPAIEKVTACNLWLQTNEVGDIYTFTKDSEKDRWAKLLTRLGKMYGSVGTQNAEVMKPTYLCGWCPVKTCHFNKS